MQTDTKKLDQLTSLRFFAALMIVFHHSVGLFGIKSAPVNLGQGVSFFFVLSGFILTYVYPKLDGWQEIKQFWRARVARIWPAYVASFLLGFWLVPFHWETRTALANLLMVQGWIPQSTYYFSYNAVSWSVSTEFFFYLAFPIFLFNWDKSWPQKLALATAILVALIGIAKLSALPDFYPPGPESAGIPVTQHGLLYINPIARLFEFVTGMCIALLWRRSSAVAWSAPVATILELTALLVCVVTMYNMKYIASWASYTTLGAPASLWLTHSGSVLAFGLLIYIIALGRGLVSQVLALPFLVVLGEISFSMYLIHKMLLGYYRLNVLEFTRLSHPLAFLSFFGVLLLASYLMWTFVEMPGRRLILGRRKIHGTTVMKKSWHDHVITGLRPLLAGLALIVVIIVTVIATPRTAPATLTPVPLAELSNTAGRAPASCNIESVDSVPFTAEPAKVARTSVKVSGWFLPEFSKKTGSPASLRIVDAAGTAGWDAKVEHWVPRPGVLAVMHGVDKGNAGFSQLLDLGSLDPGRYTLSLVFDESGAPYLCEHGRVLDVQ